MSHLGGTHHAQTNYDLAQYVQGFILLNHKGFERIGEIQKAFGQFGHWILVYFFLLCLWNFVHLKSL